LEQELSFKEALPQLQPERAMTLAGCQLTYRLGASCLVENVSLTLNPGQIVAVVGANGAGKSTLLRMLAGELQPTQGEVTLGDQPLCQWQKRAVAQRRAVLPQTALLTFGFTALEVALMGRTPHLRGGESPQDYAIAHAALAAAHVEHLVDRQYTTLSGGERQRVQLARVLAQIWEGETTRFLLLDEPTNNLDLAHQHGILEIAVAFAQRGVGVLAVLHDLNLAAQYADHIVVLKAGRVVAAAAPHQVLTPPIIYEAFQMTVLIEPHPCLNCPLVIAMPQTHSLKEI
jgi:iron complex transport system ATP-binding protein